MYYRAMLLCVIKSMLPTWGEARVVRESQAAMRAFRGHANFEPTTERDTPDTNEVFEARYRYESYVTLCSGPGNRPVTFTPGHDDKALVLSLKPSFEVGHSASGNRSRMTTSQARMYQLAL